MVFGIGGAIGAATGVLGGVLGHSDANQAAKAQRGYLDKALGENQNSIDALSQGNKRARSFVEEMLGVSRSLEDDLLGQLDPVTASAVRQIRQQQRATEAQMSQSMAQRGLDSFTTRAGAQASTQGAASNALAELSATMASRRSGAIQTGRSALMSGLGASADFEVGAASRIAGGFQDRAGLFNGVQVQAPNTAAGIGALGNSFMELHRTSVLDQAISGAAPGGSAPANPWSGFNGLPSY